MIVAVTGASGHVGSNMCRILLKGGHQVRALIHEDDRGTRGLDIERVHGDILDDGPIEELFHGADAVMHLAAVISIRGHKNHHLEQVNIEGTRHVINAILRNGVKRLVHFSSIHAIDHHPLDEPMDESRPFISEFPMPYEKAKAISEKLVIQAVKESGLDAVVINPTAMIGPNDFKPSLLGQLLIRVYNKQIPALIRGGYNWVDVRDVCKGAIASIEQGKAGERYILSGTHSELIDLSRMVSEITGRKTPTLLAPGWMARAGVPFMAAWYKMRKQHPLYTYPSLQIVKSVNKDIRNDKARTDLNYNPRPLKETLEDTINWFKKEQTLL